MNQRKQIWLLSGGNGAGKSTFYRTQLEPRGLNFVNADILARHLFPDAPEAHSYTAAKVAEEMRNRLLEEGRSFCFETVFSHPSKIDFLARAKASAASSRWCLAISGKSSRGAFRPREEPSHPIRSRSHHRLSKSARPRVSIGKRHPLRK